MARTVDVRVTRDTQPADLAAVTLDALARGERVVWLTGSRNAGRTFAAGEIVEREHPGVAGRRWPSEGKTRVFWWPANEDPSQPGTSIGWYG